MHHCIIQLKDHQIVESVGSKSKQEIYTKISRL